MEKQNNATKKTTKTETKKQLTLMSAVETIVDKAYNSHMNEKFLKQCKDEIKFVADAYGLTEQQAILFCITIECGPNNVNHYELPRFLDMRNVKTLSFGSDINEMVKMRLMRYREKDKNSFGIPEHVISALRENKAQIKRSLIMDDCDTLFELMGEWFEALDDENLLADELREDLLRLFKENSTFGFTQQILDLNLSENNTILLAYFCSQLINEEDSKIYPRQFRNIYERCIEFKRVVSEMSEGTHILMQMGLIEHVCEDGTANTGMFTLSDKAKSSLLAEFNTQKPAIKLNNLLNPDSITSKEMFYPKSMMKQVNELNAFLQPEKFAQIERRMRENGFRTGFTCLFYGAPGTGKTETVYQIARKTGRSIMVVDVPQIKSKWVGDSEKNIKALFDRYRDLTKRTDLAPILLFNEADAIFGVRKNGAENAVDKMENAIQNIILQEMESLQGILIATTNLATNLDNAFERRFLYKVKFEKPDVSVRCQIWQEMIHGLSEDDAKELAKAYDLSGGQIENIARKDTANRILYDGDANNRLAELMEYCRAESLQSTTDKQRRMGF